MEVWFCTYDSSTYSAYKNIRVKFYQKVNNLRDIYMLKYNKI